MIRVRRSVPEDRLIDSMHQIDYGGLQGRSEFLELHTIHIEDGAKFVFPSGTATEATGTSQACPVCTSVVRRTK